MTREQAIPYIGHCVDDAGAIRDIKDMPATARLVGWQCGFEPMFVAVWTYLPGEDQPDMAEAAEYAIGLLTELNWFADEPTEPDYII